VACLLVCKGIMKKKTIIEKTLGIKGDYQYKALRSHNYLQANWHANKLLALEELINLYQPEAVLDLGAGSGNFELKFYKKIKRVVAVDYNEDALNFLRKKMKEASIRNVKTYLLDLVNLPKNNKHGKFDMIIMVDVAEHLRRKDFVKIISAFKKLLNKDGKVVIITPNYQSLWPIIEKAIDAFTQIPHLEDMQHITKFTPANLKQMFISEGFRQVNFSTFNNFSFMFPSKILSSYFCGLELKMAFPWGNLIEAVFEIEL